MVMLLEGRHLQFFVHKKLNPSSSFIHTFIHLIILCKNDIFVDGYFQNEMFGEGKLFVDTPYNRGSENVLEHKHAPHVSKIVYYQNIRKHSGKNESVLSKQRHRLTNRRFQPMVAPAIGLGNVKQLVKESEPECNKYRKKALRNTCSKLSNVPHYSNWTLESVREWRKYLGNIVVDDQHKVLFCEIPKAGCTSWKVVLSLLTGNIRESDFVHKNRLAVHNYTFMRRIGLYYLNDLPEQLIIDRLKTYFKFIAVRHPFDRLVSAYYDKFVHEDPYKEWYKNMKEKIKEGYREEEEDWDDPVTIREFINFVADGGLPRDRHWTNYQLLCSPCMIDYDYIVKVESMTKDAKYILPKISGIKDYNRLPDAHSHRAGDTQKPYKELREFFNVTRQEIEKLANGPLSLDFPMFSYRFDIDTGRATCDRYSSDGQCCWINQ